MNALILILIWILILADNIFLNILACFAVMGLMGVATDLYGFKLKYIKTYETLGKNKTRD